MNKKTKSTKSSTSATITTSNGTVSPAATPVAAPAIRDAVKSASSSYVDPGALAAKPESHARPAAPAVTPPAPEAKPAPVVAAAPAPASVAKPTVTAAASGGRPGSTPVQVKFDGKNGAGPVKAVIRYSGQLATRNERVVARVGLEWFGSPRWQSQQEVELRRAGDGVFEGELAVNGKDSTGKDLMAVQLAFLAPQTKDWDSAGAPYGYYQVSALTGHVEPVRQ